MKEYRHVSEKYSIGVLLSIVGGFLDAYTYLNRGHVFVNAQTGNIVLFGLACAERSWLKASYYLLPILAFAVGIMLAELIKRNYKQKANIHWTQIVLILEVVVLVIVSMIPQGNANQVANILISFVCSLQVASFRRMNGQAFATTMCTGNLRSATEQLCAFWQEKDKNALKISLQYYGIILFFIIGAIAGAILTALFFEKTVLFGCAGLLLVWLLLFQKE